MCVRVCVCVCVGRGGGGGGKDGEDVNFSLNKWSDQHNLNRLPYAEIIKVPLPSFLSTVDRKTPW